MHFYVFFLGILWLGSSNHAFLRVLLGILWLGSSNHVFLRVLLGILWLGSSDHAFLRVFPWDPMTWDPMAWKPEIDPRKPQGGPSASTPPTARAQKLQKVFLHWSVLVVNFSAFDFKLLGLPAEHVLLASTPGRPWTPKKAQNRPQEAPGSPKSTTGGPRRSPRLKIDPRRAQEAQNQPQATPGSPKRPKKA